MGQGTEPPGAPTTTEETQRDSAAGPEGTLNQIRVMVPDRIKVLLRVLVWAELSHLVCVEQFADRDVDDGSVDDQQLRVLVHAEPVLWFWDVTD